MAVESRGGTWRAGVLSFLTLRAVGDGSAAGCFLFGTFFYSWVPVSVAFSGGAGSPLLYGVGLRLGEVAFHLVVVFLAYRSLLRALGFLALVWSCLRGKPWFAGLLLLIILSKSSFFLFAWSVLYIDISVAVVIFELQGIVWVFILSRVSGRYLRVTWWSYTLLAVAFLGVALVVLGQSGGFGSSKYVGLELWVGLGLIVAATLVSSLWVFGFRFGELLEREWALAGPSVVAGRSVLLFGCMAASVVGSLTVILTGLIASAFRGDLGAALSQGPVSPILLAPFLMGLVFGVQDSLFRKGNSINRSLGVNVIVYMAPALSLLWLFSLSLTHVARADLLVAGCFLIISANALFNLEVQARHLLGRLWVRF